ncbi:MAG: hypothetical protein J2P43_07260, partial [Candidatus Dormibacteraeota bacterium]|nr:hypothetical protein [Candidatus Dormibacteraeota bacterium]
MGLEVMVTVDERSISVQDLEEDLQRLAQVGDRGELIVELHRFQNRVSALISEEVARFDREQGYAGSGALSMTQWLRYRCHLAGRQA